MTIINTTVLPTNEISPKKNKLIETKKLYIYRESEFQGLEPYPLLASSYEGPLL